MSSKLFHTCTQVLPAMLLLLGCGPGTDRCSLEGQAASAAMPCCLGLEAKSGICRTPEPMTPPDMRLPPPRPQCSPVGEAPSASVLGQCCPALVPTGGVCTSPPPPPAKPDLEIVGWSIRRFVPASGGGTLYLCLNRDSLGSTQSYGNYIKVRNRGVAPAAPFKVGMAIVNAAGTQAFACPSLLNDASGLGSGEIAEWIGPFCCSMSIAGVPTGYYKGAVVVDATKVIDETDETNNVSIEPGSFYIP